MRQSVTVLMTSLAVISFSFPGLARCQASKALSRQQFRLYDSERTRRSVSKKVGSRQVQPPERVSGNKRVDTLAAWLHRFGKYEPLTCWLDKGRVKRVSSPLQMVR